MQLPCKTKEHCILFCSELLHSYINISRYMYSSFFWYRARNFFLQYMPFDRGHRFYFLHKYQNMSIVSSFNFLKPSGSRRTISNEYELQIPSFSSSSLEWSLCTFVRSVLTWRAVHCPAPRFLLCRSPRAYLEVELLSHRVYAVPIFLDISK